MKFVRLVSEESAIIDKVS